MSPKRPKLPGNTVDRLGATYQYLLGRKNKRAQLGVESTLNRDVRDALVSNELRQEIAGVLFHLSQLGLCSARISEASLRLGENQFLVTRENCWFQDLTEDDLILVISKTTGDAGSLPTPHCWDRHLAIYNGNPHARAIILGQPSSVLALAKDKLLPDRELLPAAATAIGNFNFWLPEIFDGSSIKEHDQVWVIPGIGVISQGRSLAEAAAALELINKLGEVTLFAKQ